MNPGWCFFTNPSEKYAQVNLDIFPNFRGENFKNIWNHNLESFGKFENQAP